MAVGEKMCFHCWAEIDLSALRANVQFVKKKLGEAVSLLAVVKANAYGHGALPVSRALQSLVEFLGVATVEEALELRKGGVEAEILLLGPAFVEEYETIISQGFVVSLSTIEEAEALHAVALRLHQQARAHLIIDTGMGRMGFLEEEIFSVHARLRELTMLDLEGIATHFPSADIDREFSCAQLERFTQLVEKLRNQGMHFSWIHVANSPGILRIAPGIQTVARPGMLLYGISPLPQFQEHLRPILTLKTRVLLVRDLPAGKGISYGRTFITTRPTRVATLAVGYGDGYSRDLSNQGTEVLIRGKRCPILGYVTMDQLMVDVTSLGNQVEAGDEVVLIGKQGEEQILATELAKKAGTIPWEIFTRLSKRVERVYC